MKASHLLAACERAGIDFFTGVPDSQLKGLCDTLYAVYGASGEQHVVAANEGGAIGLCAGHYLATGRPALCYMQNSGLGNAVNPLASLMDPQVYGLPCLLVVGWRGEPGVKDEPQHVKQGQITPGQLDLLDVPYFILGKETSDAAFDAAFDGLCEQMQQGRSAAILVRKGALRSDVTAAYSHPRPMTREAALTCLIGLAGQEDAFVSTTGKLSRELFELREGRNENHERDFLTVGSMGHASMIALGVAMRKPQKRVWCLDGDGAALMHTGHLAVIGQRKPANLVHVVFNNGAHETVGGMPVCEGGADFAAFARAAGYPAVYRAADERELRDALGTIGQQEPVLTFLEIACSLGSREDLGRPTTTPQENRDALMAFLQK